MTVTVHVILAGIIIGLLVSFMNKVLLPVRSRETQVWLVRYLKGNVWKCKSSEADLIFVGVD